MSIRGSCLCGEVSYEVTGPYDFAWNCHCRNAAELMAQPDIDGGLIGGAALDANSFGGIIAAARG